MRAHRSATPAVRCGSGKSRSQGSKRQAQMQGCKSSRRVSSRCFQLASAVQAGWGSALKGGADGAGRGAAASASERAKTGVWRLTTREAHSASSHQRSILAAAVSRKSAQPSSSLACVKPVFDPGPQAEGGADRRFAFAAPVGHELPGALGRSVDGSSGDLKLADGATPTKDGLLELPRLAAASGAQAREGAPGQRTDALACGHCRHPDTVGGTERHHLAPSPLLQRMRQGAPLSRRPRCCNACAKALRSPSTVSASATSTWSPSSSRCPINSRASSGWVWQTAAGLRQDLGV
jgi:hypothetical protein